MEQKQDIGWLTTLNNINSKVLMPAMFFTFIFFNTVINLWIHERMETVQNIIAIFIVAIVLLNFFIKPKDLFFPWIKANYVVIAYLVVRTISFINSGFDYSVARTVFFEVFFLVAITKITIDKKVVKKVYIQMFFILEIIFTLPCLILYYLGGNLGEAFLYKYTYYLQTNTTAMFSNPNTAGIMAAFAIVLVVILYKKAWSCRTKILSGIFILYNILFLFTQSTRSAEIGLVAIVFAGIVHLIFKRVSKKAICYVSIAICLLFVGVVYGFAEKNISVEPRKNNEIENQINDFSSGRYSLWKGCIIEQKSHPLIGAGSLALEKENRGKIFTEDNEYRYEMRRGNEYGPHNGYIGMISGAGWIGFVLFMAILFQRIQRAKILNKGNWYLIIIFIIGINLFESLFILNRFFTCFYLFLVLEMDEDNISLLEGKK